MTVTKTTARKVGLPVGSANALLTLAEMMGDWSGQPMVNDVFGRSTGGYIAKLTEAGLITTHDDGDESFASFTDAGIDAALALGAPEYINEYRSTPSIKDEFVSDEEEDEMEDEADEDEHATEEALEDAIAEGEASVDDEPEQIGETIRSLPTVAPQAKRPTGKHDGHEWRITGSGGYCWTCDRVVAERQKAERAAAKAAKQAEANK